MPDQQLDPEDLQEQLTEARAEVERLSSLAADREARARHLEEVAASLREDLAAARREAQAGQEEAAGLRRQVEETQARLAAAASRYREAALQAAPEIPPELVMGGSIEEIDASLEQARQTVRQIQAQLEAQTRQARVPAGSPPRSGTDLSSLSPREKIAQGLRMHGR